MWVSATDLPNIDIWVHVKEQAKRAKATKDKNLAANVQEELNKHRELMAKVKIFNGISN